MTFFLQESHEYKTLSEAKYKRLAQLSGMEYFKKQLLKPMLIERVSDSDGNMYTQEVGLLIIAAHDVD